MTSHAKHTTNFSLEHSLPDFCVDSRTVFLSSTQQKIILRWNSFIKDSIYLFRVTSSVTHKETTPPLSMLSPCARARSQVYKLFIEGDLGLREVGQVGYHQQVIDVAVEHGLEVIRNYFGYLVNQTHQETAHGVVS